MIHLNSLGNFNWVTPNLNSGKYEDMGKVSIGGECFWLREYVEGEPWTGIVDNTPLFSDVHGLHYNEKISFDPSWE